MKKHHWHAFRHEKLFEKQPQPHLALFGIEDTVVVVVLKKLFYKIYF
jgi:hypothetical protein